MQTSDYEPNSTHQLNFDLLPEIVKLVGNGRTVTLVLRGKSMRPFLEDGRDRGLLTEVNNPKVGDPILAEIAPGKFVLHRIIKIDGDNVTLLGDGNLIPEHCRTKDFRASIKGFYRKNRKTLDPVDGWKWKTYSFFWMHLRPIRRWLLAFHRRIWLKVFPPTVYKCTNFNNNENKKRI